MKLHFGVVELPYADAGSGKRRAKKSSSGSITTLGVARILESRYHIMEVFYELHGDMIADELMKGYERAAESIAMGAPIDLDPTADFSAKIENRFHEFLTNKEMDNLGIPGVPTKASLMGQSRRFKRQYKRRASRPSFVDTGLYVGAFKVWTGEDGDF